MYEILKKTAYRYMELNPISDVAYMPWLDSGFVQNENGLYDFDFNQKLPNAEYGSICCLMTVLEAEEDMRINLACDPMRDCEIYINNTLVCKTTYPDEAKPAVKQLGLDLKKGRNRLFVKCRKNRMGFGVSLGEVNIRWGTRLFYAPFAEFKGMLGFAYSKPLAEDIAVESFPDIDAMLPENWLPKPSKKNDYELRAVGGDTTFGKATYPAGVALYGLYRTGEVLGDEKILRYVKEHIRTAAKLQSGAVREKEKYGVPLVNRQLVCTDCLDDCGSFANAILNCYEGEDIPFEEAVLIEKSADWILNGQERLENGMFYRLKEGHNHYNTIWADDLFMSVPFLCRYYKRTGDEKAITDAQNQLKCFYDKLYMQDKELMSHIYSLTHQTMTGIPWGRGNGWVLFTLSEILSVAENEFLLDFFRKLCKGVLKCQDEDGMWHQLLDDWDSYAETSCTAMFVCAFARGVKNGWLLGSEYAESAKKGWTALQRTAIEANGDVTGVCRGSGYSFRREYYKYELTSKINDV
ncbi:MAG: glycoside hydrolase family 88 protein, partial [Clostridia bacterium]|nr:glycoside hydrolase family 88 protein [Clostridia bacterium]